MCISWNLVGSQCTVSHPSISIKSGHENRSRVRGRNWTLSHGAILMRSFQSGFCQIDSGSIANARPDAIKSHHPRGRSAFNCMEISHRGNVYMRKVNTYVKSPTIVFSLSHDCKTVLYLDGSILDSDRTSNSRLFNDRYSYAKFIINIFIFRAISLAGDNRCYSRSVIESVINYRSIAVYLSRTSISYLAILQTYS